MFGMGIFESIFYFLTYAITLICVWKMLIRLGFPGYYAIVAVLPFVNIIALWALAFIPWPKLDHKELKEFVKEVQTELPHLQKKIKRVLSSLKK